MTIVLKPTMSARELVSIVRRAVEVNGHGGQRTLAKSIGLIDTDMSRLLSGNITPMAARILGVEYDSYRAVY